MKNQLSQVTVTQTLSVILFSEQKLTHFTNISCEIQQNVVELIKHLSKHLPLRFNLATNEISLTKSPLNPAQSYTERFHQTEPFGSLILSTLNGDKKGRKHILDFRKSMGVPILANFGKYHMTCHMDST